jgi:beta-glucosidase
MPNRKLYFFWYLFVGPLLAEKHWSWSNINLDSISFPPTFLWGCADSAFQTEGSQVFDRTVQNSWTDYEIKSKRQLEDLVGKGCNRWDTFKEDISLIATLGMTAYRFSIEWSKIEPREGFFDQSVLDHYDTLIDEIISQGIKPFITLFHHTLPLWFAQRGGFEKKENIRYFVRYANYIFDRLHTKILFWIILNEPIGYAIEAYFRGNYPPCKKKLKLAGKVARNMMKAHVLIAQEYKYKNSSIKVGIAHIIQLLDPYHTWNPLEKIVSSFFDTVVNKSLIRFFKTGNFCWPLCLKYYNINAPNSLDFIGINYYTHTLIKHSWPLTLKTATRSFEPRLNTLHKGFMQKSIYAEGLYRAIKRASCLSIPIYVTENGVDTIDDQMREEYLKKHFYAMYRARMEGYDIRGYFYWTLVDCFSWNKGYSAHYGIFAVDPHTQQRVLRPAYHYFLETIKKSRTGII